MWCQVLGQFSASWLVQEGGQRSPVAEEFLVSDHGLSLVQVGHIVQILKDLDLWCFHPNYQKWWAIMSKAAFSVKSACILEARLGAAQAVSQTLSLLLARRVNSSWSAVTTSGMVRGQKALYLKFLKELRASQMGFKDH